MDKQDGLAAVIADAMTSGAMLDALCDGGPTSAEIIAAAVRSFMGSDEVVERVARAIYRQSDLDPDTLYEHHEWEKWPVDERREFVDAISGEPRVSLMHRGWRKRTLHARAALSAAIGEDIGGGRGGLR